MKSLAKIQETLNKEIADPAILNKLVETTFKGLSPELAKKAMFEGMVRGFKFVDFLERNVYAIPFGQAYSLVMGIDYARKIGMKNGVVGKSEPVFEEKDNQLIACSVTIKRRIKDEIGEFSEKVYLKEYSTGKNQWVTKPRTMLAKVAEMHALRMACPEDLSQAYAEEEMEREVIVIKNEANVDEWNTKLLAVKNLAELQKLWSDMPQSAKTALEKLKNELKAKFSSATPGGVAITGPSAPAMNTPAAALDNEVDVENAFNNTSVK